MDIGNITRKATILSGVAMGCVVAAMPAMAQSSGVQPGSAASPQGAQAENESPGEDTGLDIVVTARKRDEGLQSVPLSVTALSGSQLLDRGVTNLRDLNNLAPGLNFQVSNPRGGAGRLLMRGLTTGTSGSAKASVFLDGVYVTGDITNIALGQLDRIEVIPGPQSAQFGRSTFAGAINYVTRDPGDEFSGNFSGDVGSYGQLALNGWIGGPIIRDKVMLAVFGGINKFDGPSSWRNPADALHPDGVKLGRIQSVTAGAKLILKPTDTFRIEARVSHAKDDDGPPLIYFANASARTNLQGIAPNGAPRSVSYFSGTVTDLARSGPNTWSNFDQLPNPGRSANGWRTSVQADLQLGEWAITATGAYNYEKAVQQSDGDFTYFPSQHSFTTLVRKDTQFEARVTSPQHNPLRVEAGVYFINFKTPIMTDLFSDYRCTTNLTTGNTCLSPTQGTKTLVNAETLSNSTVNVRDYSVFGGIFYDITSQVTGSVEARYQIEKQLNYNSALTAFPSGLTGTFKAFLPRVNLQWRITPRIQIYGVYSLGNNPGGFNTSQFLGQGGSTLDQRTVKEEKLYNYEIGVKSTLLDGHLTLNVSAYHMDWTNLQAPQTYINNLGSFFGVTTNNGSAKIDGLTVEAAALPAKGLDIRGTFSYNNSRYSNYCSTSVYNLLGPVGKTGVQCVYVNGNKLETSPSTQASLSVGYTHPLVGSLDVATRGTYQYQSGMWESDGNFAKSKGANVLDFSVGIKTGNLSFDIYCRNCTNEDAPLRFVKLTDPRYASTGSFNNSGATVGGTLRVPRQFGVRSQYRF